MLIIKRKLLIDCAMAHLERPLEESLLFLVGDHCLTFLTTPAGLRIQRMLRQHRPITTGVTDNC